MKIADHWKKLQDWRRLKHRTLKAKLKRRAFGNKPVVGVTGSVGKTSTCAFLGHILSKRFNAKLPQSGNTMRGMRGDLIRLEASKDVAVFEVATGGPGSIAPMAKLVRPNIAIITRVSTDHYSAFRSLEATAKEKVELVLALPPDGVCLLNADDPYVRAMEAQSPCRTLFYGQAADCDYRVHDIKDRGLSGVAFSVTYGEEEQRFEISAIGTQILPSYVAGIACAHHLGMSLEQIASAAADYTNARDRCSLHQMPGRPIFINDTAKAPSGTLSDAFSVLDSVTAPRKTIFIGQIADYAGSQTSQYRKACKAASEVANRIIMLSEKAKPMRPGIDFNTETDFHLVDDVRGLKDLIDSTAIEGEVILLKSARNIHCERVVINEVAPVQCWRATCPFVYNCSQCENLLDPECATTTREPVRREWNNRDRPELIPPWPKLPAEPTGNEPQS